MSPPLPTILSPVIVALAERPFSSLPNNDAREDGHDENADKNEQKLGIHVVSSLNDKNGMNWRGSLTMDPPRPDPWHSAPPATHHRAPGIVPINDSTLGLAVNAELILEWPIKRYNPLSFQTQRPTSVGRIFLWLPTSFRRLEFVSVTGNIQQSEWNIAICLAAPVSVEIGRIGYTRHEEHQNCGSD